MKDSTELMARRIRSILLICNSYDCFSLEEDGRLETRIQQEYTELNLSNPPVLHRVETTAEALSLLEKGERFDLVITMYYVGELSVFDFASRAKSYAPSTPVVLLASFAREIYNRIDGRSCNDLDYVFCWNNSPDLIIAIIKLMEDSLNAEHDIIEEGVQAILLVEDSVRYYSTYLPALYRLVLEQNKESIKDTLNEQEKLLRKRSRPKILMASNYNDAVALYRKYKDNLLGIISDVGFVINEGDRREDEKKDAGVDFCRLVKADNPKMPFLMQSAQESMRNVANELGAGFLWKASSTLLQELGDYLEREFGFGDFVVSDPLTHTETARAHDLFEFENVIKTIPDREFEALSGNNYLSKWLYARGLFELARELRAIRSESYSDISSHRAADLKIIHDFRISQALGVVASFNPATYNDTISFARTGSGSLGGKARGLAFLNHILQKYRLYSNWDNVRVLVPRTLVVTTEYFDRFIKANGLKYVINAGLEDNEILSEFVSSPLPQDLLDALKAFLRQTRCPLAVRSSSKLEDSYHQPFAGVYSTYMIPCVENEDQRLRLLSKAIASVWASVFFSSARSYIISSGNVLSEEKMAIVIQEVCGSEEGGLWFPTLSGVARSVNFYPVGHEEASDGIVKLAYGLGKAVVDGEKVLRFSPSYPKNVLQTSTPELVMTQTQEVVYALDLRPEKFKTSVNDAVNLKKLTLNECADFPSFKKVASTWDASNQRIVDSAIPDGPKFITFSSMLKYHSLPLPEIVSKILSIAKKEIKCDVEIEFAADMSDPERTFFSVLQVRPISVDTRFAEIDWDKVDDSSAFLKSSCALGTGWIEGVRDLIYVKKETWNCLKTTEIAKEVSAMNKSMLEKGRGYVLIGFGRWGTAERSLGIPVQWSDISEAKALVECSLEDFQVEPSQGTHFFQNLTSFNVGYINVDPYSRRGDSIDFSVLDSVDAVEETQYLRHLTLTDDVKLCVDGKTGRAIISLHFKDN